MRRSRLFLFRVALASVPAVLPGMTGLALAQVAVVQPTRGGDATRLNLALGRLARNPRDVEALIDAGVASLAAGDGDAAVGFYQKADALSPGNARIKAGLAGAYVLGGDPVAAIPLFDEAERLGPIDAARVADRGLAFDMVGDPATAQRYYHEALMAGVHDETSRRLALSQAISGDRRAMEVTLGPLLQKQDKAAWRIRAFSLAILGQVDQAESIAESTMPADLAAAIANYLRYMPKLTAAQQAAAANLGRFPRAAEIGRDDPRFAQLVRTHPALASATQALTPVGQPLGRVATSDSAKRSKPVSKAPSPVPPPVSVAVSQPLPIPTPAPAAAPPATAMVTPPRPASTGVAVNTALSTRPAPTGELAPIATSPVSAAPAAALPVATPPPVPVAAPKPQPGFTTLDSSSANFALKPGTPAAVAPVVPPPAPQPAPPVPEARPAAPKPTAPVAKPRSLAEVFADLTPPSREAEPEAGAVDLRKIKSASPKPAANEAKAAKGVDKTCEVPDPKTLRTAKGKAKAKAVAAQCKDADQTTSERGKGEHGKGEHGKGERGKAEKSKALANPSRIWVQVATGRDKKGLAFDWRRFIKDDPRLFKGHKAYVSQWGQTNRLLTGPFDTTAQATAFIAQLKKADHDGAFLWSSPAGQVVDALPGG